MKLRRHEAEARLRTDLRLVGSLTAKGRTRYVVRRRHHHRGAPYLLTIIGR